MDSKDPIEKGAEQIASMQKFQNTLIVITIYGFSGQQIRDRTFEELGKTPGIFLEMLERQKL